MEVFKGAVGFGVVDFVLLSGEERGGVFEIALRRVLERIRVSEG